MLAAHLGVKSLDFSFSLKWFPCNIDDWLDSQDLMLYSDVSKNTFVILENSIHSGP